MNKATEKELLKSIEEKDELIKALKEQDTKFQELYALSNKKYQEVYELLDSVINNIEGAIIATTIKQGVFLRNKAAKELINKYSEERIFNILREFSSEGIYDFKIDEAYFHLSISSIRSEDNFGYVYIIENITKMKILEHEKSRNEKLQLMGEMVANITHEVRNPLGSIELFASLLARDLESDPEKKRLVSSIIKGVRNINALISNTLLFTKEVTVSKSEYILSDIVDEVVLYLQHIIKDRSVRFINKLNDDHKIYCDSDMYKQVVMNVISNACDAVSKNGTITASSEIKDSKLYFSIVDNGSGIAEDMLPRLFMPFQTTKAKGTGLGLSIAYKIIKAHDGDILVTSKGSAGSSTKFTIVTPSKS